MTPISSSVVKNSRLLLNIQNARINTAGAYISLDGCYVFAIGIRPHNGHIPVVRLGGHRESDETGWQCAVREVFEEANLLIKPIFPSMTYLVDWDHLETEFQQIHWRMKNQGEPVPILAVAHCREEDIQFSLMYFAHAEGLPTPSSEVKGLLLLKEEEVHRLCQEPITLGEYLHRGGKALLNAQFDKALLLEPFTQLRLLSKILGMRSEIQIQPGTQQGT